MTTNSELRTHNPELPNHVGFIMDGNRRWAKAHGKLPIQGHEVGLEVLHDVARACFDAGVKVVSFYAFSTENWKRAEQEVSFLMSLVPFAKKKFLGELKHDGIRTVIIGSRNGLSDKVTDIIDQVERETEYNTNGTLALCFNYGGLSELADMVRNVVESGVDTGSLTGDDLYKYLYHPEVPPCDLIVRTSGEKRLSGFMLARSEYAEFIFDDKMWPDITAADVSEYLSEFATRQRRIGA